ncbi:hypothetical protein GLP30_14100 [Photobacterium phosphoreum]|uniref:DUF4105 domain-containing protein n=1 Tax=Photobacterium phosphoreum TaxID=659 RepID=A0AAW4ZZX1_PHOPO|nr:hypothetical protein [Photobacterium phosphoreum]MCD9492051.1 hypothetical protein [Photobacterium phosphoreum]MCF2191221.1 hypothetical protein [Photobacterium phosphoreum]MCF2302883.1 hypothetical protein [Photobacterium phosphoreum]
MNKTQRFLISLFLSISIIITEAIILSHMSTGAGVYIGIPLVCALAIIVFIISYFWIFKCIRPILKTFSIVVTILIFQFGVLFFFQPMEIKTPYRLTADVLKILLKYDKLSIEDLYSGSSEQNMVVSYKFQHYLPGYLISFYTRENNCHKKANNNVANIYIHNDNYYLSNKHLKINKKSNTLIINNNLVVNLALLSSIPINKKPIALDTITPDPPCSDHKSLLFVTKFRLYDYKEYAQLSMRSFIPKKILSIFFSPQEKTQPLQLKVIPKTE